MKKHKKLYKAGKNWLVATLAVATLGIIASQQTVSADNNYADDVTASQKTTLSIMMRLIARKVLIIVLFKPRLQLVITYKVPV